MIRLPTFTERFNYLKLDGRVGESTFGFERYLNQKFYTSQVWKKLRNEIIIRDNGCDLAVEGETIFGKLFIHHLNPITSEDIERQTAALLDPDFLVCVSYDTHNAIHFGDAKQVVRTPTVRTPFDTCPWRLT